jgi:PEP-CTERM motif
MARNGMTTEGDSMRTRRPCGLTVLVWGAFLLLLGLAEPCKAALVLTSAGIAEGLTLSTFASGFPNTSNVGPLGIVFPASGGVLVSDLPGNVRRFTTDTDGQLASGAVLGQSYGNDLAQDIARLGNNIYMTQRGNLNQLIQINDNGTFNRVIVGGMPGALGLVANPTNGHLIVSTGGDNQLWDVNPVTLTKTPFISTSFDGMTTDGTILYGAEDLGALNGHVLGFRLSDKSLVFDSGLIPGGVDGTSLGFGKLAGNIFVNTNSGTVFEVNLATGLQTLIATGGSRGDFVSPDPNDNSLLLTQTDRIIRLTAPSGSGFGPPPPVLPLTVPEPSSLALLSLGGLALASWRRWRKRPATA